MQITNFLTKENVNTLWDVISDEDLFKSLHRDAQSQILQVFSSNIKGFFENEKTKTNNLIDMNKKYIMLILNYIKTNFSQQKYNKIKILEESPVKELITYEEIQNDRKSQFEKDLGRLQEEFTNSMTLPVPEVPTFADKYEDKPISEMDKMIKEMTAKRNYEVEQINRIYQDANSASNWLQPQETSIKTEKFVPLKEEPPQNSKKIKYLNIEQRDNVEVTSPKKNVTWGEDTDIFLEADNKDELDANIFKKLKKVSNATENVNSSINDITNESRITKLESGLDILNQKVDLIIDLLKQNK
jgi:hypothetical protein